MSQEAMDAATAKVEEGWQRHFHALEAPMAAIRKVLADHQAATGVGMGPQLDAAASLAAQAAVDHADNFKEAAEGKRLALLGEHDRDQIAQGMPEPAPDKPAPLLAQGEPIAIREWLKTATPEQVTDVLGEIGQDDARVAWANQMMAWLQEDGNTAAVIETVRGAQANPETLNGTG